jgi:Leucine-rich repeat (LRR) protein
MKQMIWLNFFDNEIETIDEEVLLNLKQYFISSNYAKSLRLGYNKLTHFPEVFTKMVYLQELHLAGNDFNGFLNFFSLSFN